MARVQYGTIVTEIKGKIQGQVFQGGNVGFVLRNKGYTKGIPTSRRNVANSRLSTIAAAWRSLTDEQRSAWNDITPDWIFYNRFGAAYEGSGFQVFMAYNGYLGVFFLPVVEEPGIVDSPDDPGAITFNVVTQGALPIVCANLGDANDYMYVYAARPTSQGKNVNSLRTKLITAIEGTLWDDADIWNPYTEAYGEPVEGQRISVIIDFHRQSYPYPYFRQTLTAIYPAP